MATRLGLALLLMCCALSARAQVPHILGTWKLNVPASRLPGPAPQTHVRRYSLGPDGTIIGLAVMVDAQGNPGFLQFAAKPDGKDYPELDARSAAQYLIDGSAPLATYAETPVDSRTVEWVDKYEGTVIASGRKWVSEDGRTLTFTAVVKGEDDEEREFLFVFDRVVPDEAN
ncbi:MAG TPA: hypothetical protein VIN61_05055 [Gammaproteobacteria bacterium]